VRYRATGGKPYELISDREACGTMTGIASSQQERTSVRVLVVDDFDPFRRFVCTTLQKPGFIVVGEASDGIEAVRKSKELQPDLVVLDMGLPSLNGIRVARQIRKLSNKSKILFLSQESSADVVQEALSTGARGYVVKTEARNELLEAASAVLRGEQFVGRRFSGHHFIGSDAVLSRKLSESASAQSRHEVGFYSEDTGLLERLTGFIEAALSAGNAAVVVATESHRDSLLLRLQATGLDIVAAIEEGRYIALDAVDALTQFMVNGLPDAVGFLSLLGKIVAQASEAAKGEESRIAIFGECVDILCAQGNVEAAIQVEKLGNQLAKEHDLDILCGYNLRTVHGSSNSHISQQICAEHSAAYSW
jgi:DNA-binding NarL/FixJ family response regulator